MVNHRTLSCFYGIGILFLLWPVPALSRDLVLQNGTISLRLEVNPNGVPYISEARWADGKRLLQETERTAGMDRRLPGDAADFSGTTAASWREVDHPLFYRAEASRTRADGLRIVWTIDLARRGSLFRTSVRLANEGAAPQAISCYPVWHGRWKTFGRAARLRYWQALTFHPETEAFGEKKTVRLGSRLHSSDDVSQGQNPYWEWSGEKGQLYFSLDWCGGWRAELGKDSEPDTFSFRVDLPPEETQLTLSPGETVTGPVLTVFAGRAAGEVEGRAEWMTQRLSLGRSLYGGPPPSYPFSYNHWYTTRFQCNGEFLQRQVDNMKPYGFDALVVDAGWYRSVGEWTPDPAKFRPGQFEAILAAAKAGGARVGIWSCPQFVKSEAQTLPPNIVQPAFYQKFIDGFLLEYAGMDFTRFLLDHTAGLRRRYFMDWWKYDQDFFAAQSRHGLMKNVIAFQAALLAVRKAQPDLYMENCQSGGRMINEFTVLTTQNQWIRDGGGTGPNHAKSNFLEALGALQFLPPWTVNRWTNNPDRNNPADDEFTRMYCRSAMAGTWGLVADLARIEERQRRIILTEVHHYRRLNLLKNDCRYDLIYPLDDSPVAGVVYYNAAGSRAGILLMRWEAADSFTMKLPLKGLSPREACRVEDVDAGSSRTLPGAELRKQGLAVTFAKGRNSLLLFVASEP